MTLLGSVLVLVHLIVPFVVSDYTAVVRTSSGPVQGVIDRTLNRIEYAAFVGIRYAEPPVGKLRFQPPVAVSPWTEPVIATVAGNMCPQRGAHGAVIGDEDCLFLNVFTPVTELSEIPTEQKSVMVWIHEGSFADGSGNMDIKKPDFLLEKDVVLVSLNYRLGALGFLSLDHHEATGNQGLKDQRLALEWVQKNIEKFGGDRRSVTIFGKDAGAASVGYHILSRSSKGLFSAAISMSGTPLGLRSFVSKEEATQRGSKLAALLGIRQSKFLRTKKASLKTLYDATPTELVEKAFDIDQHAPFVPTVEDAAKATEIFLFDDPIRKYKSGRFQKVPQILGFAIPDTKQYSYNKEDFIGMIKKSTKNIEAATGEVPIALRFLKASAKEFDHKAGDVGNALERSAAYVANDMLFKAPVQLTRRLLAQRNGQEPIYFYDFTFSPDVSPGTSKGTFSSNDVAEELACTFYIPSNGYDLGPGSRTARTIESVVTLWTNFAKYANPTPYPLARDSLSITWRPFKSSGPGLRIGNRFEIVTTPTNILFDPMTLPYNGLFRG